MRKKAVIFDMDGLLIDSEPLWKKAEIAVFKKVGIQLDHQICLQTMGLRIDEVVEYWYSRHPWKNYSQESVMESILVAVENAIANEGKAMPGVARAIQLLKDLELPIAIASSSKYRTIDKVVEQLGIKDHFDVIYSAEEEIFGKPHPGVFITTANKLGVAPQDCLVFEDSFNGVLAGKAAKMQVIAIPDIDHQSDIRFSIADIKLNSLTDFQIDMLG